VADNDRPSKPQKPKSQQQPPGKKKDDWDDAAPLAGDDAEETLDFSELDSLLSEEHTGPIAVAAPPEPVAAADDAPEFDEGGTRPGIDVSALERVDREAQSEAWDTGAETVLQPSRARSLTPPPPLPTRPRSLTPMPTPPSLPDPPAPDEVEPSRAKHANGDSPQALAALARERAKQPPRTTPVPPPPEPTSDDDYRSALDDPAPPVADEERSPLNDKNLFRTESQRLARARDWQGLAGLTSAVLDGGSWAAVPETRAALYADLGRIYRDRLKDLPSAEDAFRRLAEIEPANSDALGFLSARFEENKDWRALYDLYGRAIEATWDETQRLDWTRKTADLGLHQLASRDLAIEAWERLFRLGDAEDETARALSEHYRKAGRWDRLAEFLARRAESLDGVRRLVALREVAEAYLSGMRDQDKAAEVLGQILSVRPGDPIALLAMARVLARRRSWEELAGLPIRAKDVSPAALLDLRRVVADALRSADEHDRAIVVYEQILAVEPRDVEALAAKQDYLSRSGKIEELVTFLSSRADQVESEEERVKLLERAASVAEKDMGNPRLAVSLWEKRAALSTGRLEAYQALVALYDSLGDNEGLRRALEGQLALTRQPAARLELLRHLGDHCAHRLSDDARAEVCWREILATVPDDPKVRDELVALYRRRGDFEALDRTFSAHAWRSLDDGALLGLWRAAAANVQENLGDPERAVRAWQRVTDLQPTEPEALEALVQHRRALGQRQQLIAALEASLSASTGSVESKIDRALEIASLWEAEGDVPATLAAYERVLRYQPANARALGQLGKLRVKEVGATQGTLDVAVTHVEGAARLQFVEESRALLPADDKLGHFFALRRLLRLGGSAQLVDELTRAAEAAGAPSELEPVYLDLAADATDGDRAAMHERLAGLYQHQLKDPVRAFLVLQAARQSPVAGLDELEPLFKLAEATGRHEDHLALLDVAARAGVDAAVRKEALRRRMRICEKELKSEERAFAECVRLLRLDPRDHQALVDAQRLATARKLWRPLDALYAELWDQADSTAQRIELSRARYTVHAEHLKDKAGALDQLIIIYRLDPTAGGIEAQLLAAAEHDKAWDRVLPIIEARAHAADGDRPETADELGRIAALHEEKRKDQARAFELYAEAFLRQPSSVDLEKKLEALAGSTKRWEALAETLRAAAARSSNPLRTLELHRRVAAIYAKELGRPELALDVHRRILQLDPRSLPSLEVVIAHQRDAKLWRELRDRLQQWLDVAGPEAALPERVARSLEIAQISRAELADPETALATYAQVLDVDAANAEALAGIRSLTEGVVDPQLEVRRLRIELGRTQGPRRVEILTRCAEIQAQQLDDEDAAITSLRQLVDETGTDGPGFGPLSAAYEKAKRWGDLSDLLEQRAQKITDPAAQLTELERAVALLDAHPEAGAERRERIYRALLDRRPTDASTRRRLLGLYRSSARHAELVGLLEESLKQLSGKGHSDGEELRLVEDELVRLLITLGRQAEAGKLLEARLGRDPGDVETLLGLATLSLQANDLPRYLKLRGEEAKARDPRPGALVLCHLAEACDEKLNDQAKVLEYYRAARALDPANQPAMEALKAIGRRTKNWRSGAALLNDSDEKTLAWSERATRLSERGAACLADDPDVASSWFERAVAVDPNHFQAWDGLAQVAERRGDGDGALVARRAGLSAFERATAPDPAGLLPHAERIEALAAALRAVPDDAEPVRIEERQQQAARLSRRAYDLQPTLAPAALAVADQRLADEDIDEAYAIYDRVVQAAATLAVKERLHAYFQRGVLNARLHRLDEAILDLREGLRIDQLHSGLLNALAQVLAEKGRIAAAIQHYTQALLLASEEQLRGQLYARLGRLWEDRLGQLEEAGVCYDQAIASGVGDAELMVRALGHYRRSGQTERALEVIEHLLPATTKPSELALLWAERGHILMSAEPPKRNEDGAMEAFDMALSYDSSCQTAVNGLAALLEKRGDWKQLVELLEVRAEAGAATERAEAMRALARICQTHLHDVGRAERFLLSAIELAAVRDDYEQLIKLYGEDPTRDDEKKEALAGMLSLGGPYMPRLIELGKGLFADGRRRWAWCVLSPLMNSSMPDPQLKSMVLELRKEFEKAENLAALSPNTHRLVRPKELSDEMMDLLVELDGLVQLAPTTPEQLGAGGAAKLDGRTATGKTFLAIAERLGLEGASLARVQELPVPFVILDGETPQIVARGDLFQLLSPAETNALFATMLEAARPGARVLAALGSSGALLIPALAGASYAVDPAQLSAEERVLVEEIRLHVDAGVLERWKATLAVTTLEEARALGTKLVHAIWDGARRVGLVAAADLRFASKLLTRLDESLPKLPTAGKVEDLDEFFASAAPARGLVAFASSPRFGRALEGGAS